MARFYMPRQIQTGENKGKWHMTVSSDEEGWCHAVGYCERVAACPECEKDPAKMIALPMEERKDDCAICHGSRLVDRDPLCLGHDTADGAFQHWLQFQVEQHNIKTADPDNKQKCEICSEWTTWRREVGPRWALIYTFVLCGNHNTDGQAGELFLAC